MNLCLKGQRQILFKLILVFAIRLIHKMQARSFNQVDKIGLKVSQYFLYPRQVSGDKLYNRTISFFWASLKAMTASSRRHPLKTFC